MSSTLKKLTRETESALACKQRSLELEKVYPVLSTAHIKLYPWYYRKFKPRYNPTLRTLAASPPLLPLTIAWTSPILVSRTPPPSSPLFTHKYEAFAVITRTLCKIWSPNAHPDIPYPGVLPKGWSWDRPESWLQPGFEDGSLGRFDFSYIPQAIPSRYLFHWAFVEASSSSTYPPILRRNPLDAWVEVAFGDRGSFQSGYIHDIIQLWKATRDAVGRLSSPPPESFSAQIRHPSQTPEWHTLQDSESAMLFFLSLNTWQEAIQSLTVWHRSIVDARAYFAFRKAIDCTSHASAAKYLGCWSNDLDVEVIKVLIDRDIPVYFIEDTTTCGTRFPRGPAVYHDVSALLDHGHQFVKSSVQFAPGSSCRSPAGADKTWTSATHHSTIPSLSITNLWGVPCSSSKSESGSGWGPGASGSNVSGWNIQENPDSSTNARRVIAASDFVPPRNPLPSPTLIQPQTRRHTQAHSSERLAGQSSVPPTYEDITLETPSNAKGSWKNWVQCNCDLKAGKHMFQVSKRPKNEENHLVLFYDIDNRRHIYLQDLEVRNSLYGIKAPAQIGYDNIFDGDSDCDDNGTGDYGALGSDIPAGFSMECVEFWSYGHKNLQPFTTNVWWKDRKPEPPHKQLHTVGNGDDVPMDDAPPLPFQSMAKTRNGFITTTSIRGETTDAHPEAFTCMDVDTHAITPVAHTDVPGGISHPDRTQSFPIINGTAVTVTESPAFDTPGATPPTTIRTRSPDRASLPSSTLSLSTALAKSRHSAQPGMQLKSPDSRPRVCPNRHLTDKEQMALLKRNRLKKIELFEKRLREGESCGDTQSIKKYTTLLATQRRQFNSRHRKLEGGQDSEDRGSTGLPVGIV